MKSTGIIRKMDSLYRVALPKRLCETNNLSPNTLFEIFVENNNIVLSKYHNMCVFCHSTENLVEFHKWLVCTECIDALKNQ